MRYIGSKIKVLSFIENTIKQSVGELNGKVFADLFSGTAIVAKHFKNLGCEVISNDYMSFSYAMQVAYLKFNEEPTFNSILNKQIVDYESVVNYLNLLKPISGFFFKNYSIQGNENGPERNYFSGENAKKIDAILNQIKQWKSEHLISDNEEFLLRASLIDAATKVSNISGTYGAFLKIDDQRKFKEIYLEPIEIEGSIINTHSCYNCDVFDVIEKVSGDILYLDPPYNNRQYPPYYHILETLALDDSPNIYGITGRRPYRDKISPFCIKNKVGNAFGELLNKANFQHVFISYNTDGLLNLEEMEKILGQYGEVKKYYQEQRRYKSNGNGNLTAQLKEIIFYVKKSETKD